LQSRIIEDLSQLSALQDAWRGLQPSVRYPFHELGWYLAWARTIGTTGGRRLKCVTLWDGGRLVAMLPLALRRYKGVRLLGWMGARATDYCDAIIAPGVDAHDALKAAWRSLNRDVAFDVLRLQHVRTDALINGFIEDLDPWVETREGAYTIPLTWSSGADWLASRSSKRRDSFRQRLRYMDKNGFEFKTWRTPETDVLQAALEQKQVWIKARDASGFVIEPQGPEFLSAFADELSSLGLLHLSAIRSAERIVACHVGFVRDDTYYYYMPTYDAAFAKQSFGTSLREHLIMWACDQGLKKFDMLLGAHEYKSHYGAIEDVVRTLVVPRGLLGRAAVAYYRRASARAQRNATAENSTAPA
jgi:CelD/BcsL family acetyltransferase involved in cellulose biosynthesis